MEKVDLVVRELLLDLVNDTLRKRALSSPVATLERYEHR
jgi:hypothetical protein